MKKTVAAVLAAAMALSVGATTAFAVGYDASGLASPDWEIAMQSADYTTDKTAKVTTTGEDKTTDSELSANVTYTVNEAYTWTIHNDINFGADKGPGKSDVTATGTVAVSQNVISEGKKLNITITGNGGNVYPFSIKTATASNPEVLAYTVTSGNSAFASGNTILDVPAGTNTGSIELTFTLSTRTNAEIAGSYKGTVTYNASIIDNK